MEGSACTPRAAKNTNHMSVVVVAARRSAKMVRFMRRPPKAPNVGGHRHAASAAKRHRAAVCPRGPTSSTSCGFVRYKLYLQITANRSGVPFQRRQRRRVPTGSLQARNCTLCRTHALCNCVLRQTSLSTCPEHLTCNCVFEFKAVVCIIEPRALPRGRQKFSVIVRNWFVLQVSHASPPLGAFAPSSIRCPGSAAIS